MTAERDQARDRAVMAEFELAAANLNMDVINSRNAGLRAELAAAREEAAKLRAGQDFAGAAPWAPHETLHATGVHLSCANMHSRVCVYCLPRLTAVTS